MDVLDFCQKIQIHPCSLEILGEVSDFETFRDISHVQVEKQPQKRIQGWFFVWTSPLPMRPVRESRQWKMYQLSQLSRGISVPKKLVQSASC